MREVSIKTHIRKSIMATTLAVPTSLVLTGFALADSMGESGGGYHTGYMGWGHGGGIMTFGHVMLIGLVVLIVLAVIMLVNRGKNTPGHGAHGAAPGSSAIAILEERYARGEIDHEEFEERKRRLET